MAKSRINKHYKIRTVVKSAESPRMKGLARIPTVERRDAAVDLLLKRAQ